MEPGRRTFPTDDGIELVADVWGEAGAPPVILAHGGGQTRYAWGGTARELASQGWQATSLDLRGHGESGWSPNANYEFERFAADLVTVARGLGRPVAVGASLGGVAALIAEGDAEASIFSALVLVDITPRMEPKGVEKIMGFMSANLEEGFASLEDAADAIASYLPHRPRPTDLSGLEKNLRLGEDGRYRWHWDPRFVTGGRPPGRAATTRDRLDACCRRIRIPTLLVRGRMSELVSEEHAQHFLSVVPHAEYVDVSGAAHMVAGDRNDAFTRAVVDFLRKLPTE